MQIKSYSSATQLPLKESILINQAILARLLAMKVRLFMLKCNYWLLNLINTYVYHSGCWDVDEHEILGRVAPPANNYVTIHFDRDTSDGMTRNTVSTGMENGSEYNEN
jgi:hypothetical protein